MENSVPIDASNECVLKARLQCCNACPRKVREALQKIKGVTSVEIDEGQELVKVTGNIHVSKYIKAIKSVGKVVVYEVGPDGEPIGNPSDNHEEDVRAKNSMFKGLRAFLCPCKKKQKKSA